MRITHWQLKQKVADVGLHVCSRNGYYAVESVDGSKTLCTGTASECWYWCDGYEAAQREAKKTEEAEEDET